MNSDWIDRLMCQKVVSKGIDFIEVFICVFLVNTLVILLKNGIV
ncbi:hypothetical protein [Gilliamella sp. Pra-s65]|nr:hypothetical protein [Gilliamella sp. Pra-s65]